MSQSEWGLSIEPYNVSIPIACGALSSEHSWQQHRPLPVHANRVASTAPVMRTGKFRT